MIVSVVPHSNFQIHGVTMATNVTKPFLPPKAEFLEYVDLIWDNGQLTNQGPLLKEFEHAAVDFLNVDRFHFVANGTLALQLALRTLEQRDGEIITTPFSYVATISSILWEGYKPVFVDINPQSFCIDPERIEDAINEKTRAILPVHVFGNPCDVERIKAVADDHDLPVIYDASHAFGVQYNGRSLFSYGDISTCSFHATKLFHTIEGGGIFTSDEDLSEKIELMKRFGHNGDDHQMLGINAKATEFQAAFGLINLKHIAAIIARRKALTEQYDKELPEVIRRPIYRDGTTRNYSYYPAVLEDSEAVTRVLRKLAAIDIYPRRYFYPSLNNLPYINDGESCPVAEDIAERIICLPLYDSLDPKIVSEICEVLKND